MAQAGDFLVPTDAYGRSVEALAPSGGTVEIASSNVAAGSYLPGNRDDILTRHTVVRITCTKDTYIRFSTGPGAAVAGDPYFIAGTEPMKVPLGKNYVSVLTAKVGEAGIASFTVLG